MLGSTDPSLCCDRRHLGWPCVQDSRSGEISTRPSSGLPDWLVGMDGAKGKELIKKSRTVAVQHCSSGGAWSEARLLLLHLKGGPPAVSKLQSGEQKARLPPFTIAPLLNTDWWARSQAEALQNSVLTAHIY